MRPTPFLLASIVLGHLTALVPAQTGWQMRIWSGRSKHALAYDSARGRVVLFGGDEGYSSSFLSDTWEWDGNAWTQRTPATSPSVRSGHALAYDSARGRVVLFGGSNSSSFLSDTWEWDGNAWMQRTPATSPPARYGHALAYDSARGRVVLFGGFGDSSPYLLSDTWEWDGNAWTQRTPATSPPPRGYHALAFDSARGRVVLFGGSNSSSFLSDTWEWDGNAWTQRTPATSPPARYGHALAYDSARGRVVLFGGFFNGSFLSDTWEWDGNAWTQRTPATSPPARAYLALAYDSAHGKVVLFGGGSSLGIYSDSWEWDGNAWMQRTQGASPFARYGHALANDSTRGKVVLFGGDTSWGIYGYPAFSDTWEWDGNAWTRRTPGASPPARAYHALAFDSARGRVVLFGGVDEFNSTTLSDTWEWDGNTWTQRTPATSPPASIGHALAYDSARGKVVLFGVGSYWGRYSDTWEWDGNAWTQRTPAASPPARGDHALAYDSARGKVVLFGGSNGSATLADTWEWDGNAWMQRTPAASPPAGGGRATYDSARGRVVLFRGAGLSDPWEWDGNAWTQRTPAAGPPARGGYALAYDSARGKVVLFGGSGSSLLSDTWEYGPDHPASYAAFGNGCSGSAGVPALGAALDQLPWIADSFRIELTRLPANAATFLLLGSSRAAWGLIPLPLPLDGLGMTGCTLYASGDLILPVPNTGGFGSLTFSVPNDPALVASSFFNQGLVLDPPANPAGITFSNAAEGRIGAK